MKKFLLFLLAFSPCWSLAQSSDQDSILADGEKYLTIKGIELKPGLRMDKMLDLLESKGLKKSNYFDYVKEKYNGYSLTGSFFNFHNCDIKVLPTDRDKNIVGVISITFPECFTFKQLKTDYDRLKDALLYKYYLYGSEEYFDDKYVEESSSDYLKLQALNHDECKFKSIFYVSGYQESLLRGQVVLSISHISVDYEHKYYLSLSYCTPDNIIEQLSRDDDL